MTKDYLKFRQCLKKDSSLTLEECFLYEVLFDNYNEEKGFAYPSYKDLMEDLRTTRKAKISDLLKSLVKKGFILKKKCGRRNHYFLKKFLFFYDSKTKQTYDLSFKETSEDNNIIDISIINVKDTPEDSNGNTPIENQIHFSEVIKEDTKEYGLITKLGYTVKEAHELLKISKNNIDRVIKSIKYSAKRGKGRELKYIKWCITNFDKILKTLEREKNKYNSNNNFNSNSSNNNFYSNSSNNNFYSNNKKGPSFFNFESRNYDYNDLEKISGDILVNTTPVGMYPNMGKSPVSEEVISKFNDIVDIIYNPEETEFLRLGKKLNKKTCGGLYMLVGQAIKSEEIWQDKVIDKHIIDTIFNEIAKEFK